VVVAKPRLDELVHLVDLLVEDHHLLRQRVHQLSGQFLPGKTCVLPFGGLDSGPGEPVSADDLAVA
jgi:hypothetical protein